MNELKTEVGFPSSGSVAKVFPKDILHLQHRVSYEGERLSLPLPTHLGETNFKERSKMCSMLVASGCNVPDRTSLKTVELLDALGVFSHQKCVLIGSHAFSAIGNSLGVTWDANTSETKDIDLGRMLKLAGSQPIKVSERLLKIGFRAIPQLNHKHMPTNFKHKNGMKIDFLTPLIGNPGQKPSRLSGTDVFAEPLRFLDYLIKDPQQAAVITRNGVLVYVPQAVRYALHKCIIYQYRRDLDKKEKDLLQAEALLLVLEDTMPHLIKAAWDDLQWQDKAMVGISEFKDTELVGRLKAILAA
ncbi:MAG: nucleotidyltransferase domain-containing protein [Desulfobacula sp.]|nr:nucleotidyltransferase domain-containing protein [Desulfobacula sp.]